MGSSFTNVHIRTRDTNAVKDAFLKIEACPAFVSKADENWVSAYSERTDSQNEDVMKSICEQLSASLNTGVLGLIVHDSDILIYVLAENGKVIDEYNSCPGYFDGEDSPPNGGNVERLLKYCVAGTSADALDSLLKSGGKGLPGAMGDMMGVGSVKKQLVKSSPWWAKPVVWTAMSLLEARNKSTGATTTAPPLSPEMADAIWRGDRLASAMARVLGIAEERVKASYGHIEDGSADINRRSLIEVGHDMVKADFVPTEEQQAMADAMMQEMIAPISKRPSYPDFLKICKEILNAPPEQESFKRICVANGMKFKQQTMNMMGLGRSPIWWIFTFEADQMKTRKFGLTALPQDGLVQCAMHELCKFPHLDAPDARSFDAEFEYAAKIAEQVLGPPSLTGRDHGNHKYIAWRGGSAYLFVFQSPADELSPYKTLEIWWEPWQQSEPPVIAGNVSDCLQKRHPTLF